MHRAVFFRQFFPSPEQRRFNLVICAYTFMEFSSVQERMKIVEELWSLTDK